MEIIGFSYCKSLFSMFYSLFVVVVALLTKGYAWALKG